MATRKSDDTGGGDDMDRKADPAVDAPPDLTSDPIEPRDFAPDPTQAEHRALDTFAGDPTPDEYSGRASVEPDGRTPWGPASRADESDANDDIEPEPAPRAPFERDMADTARATAATPGQSEPASFAQTAAPPPTPAPKKRSSFAAKALTFLILLIAGAALGIWGAPKLVPLLPAGMEPVAAWLTPGRTEAEARLAAIESAVADVSTRVAAAPTLDAIEAQAQSLVGAAQTDLAARIDAIQATLDQSDFTDANERIGRLETTLAGATTELASMRDQIAAGATSGLSNAAVASIDTYRTELDGLRAEVNDLSGSVSGLSAQLQETIASAEARTTAAEQQAQEVQQAAVAERDLAAAQADIAAIRAALADGGPFADPLAALATNAAIAPPAGLEAAAATGVETLAALRASFSDQAHEAIRASIVAGAGEGLLARSRAFLVSNVASRSLSPRDGASPDAVLSRAEDALRRDDLSAALSEVEQLPSEATAALGDWIAAAKLRADAEAGLAEVSASVSATN